MSAKAIVNMGSVFRYAVFLTFLIYMYFFAPLVLAQQSDNKSRQIEEVVILAHPLSAEGLAQPVSVLQGEALIKALGSSIGSTIDGLPGVHSQSFGNAASRPVIHGLAGPRIRVMEDRIDTLDVSVTSTDHAVTVEPFIADKVEVLKGASTLLYGSGAIGGVVDVHAGRIPHAVPARAVSGRLETRYADNADQKVGALRLDGGAGQVAWHLDAFGRDADIYDIPDFAESARQRAGEAADEEEARDKLPGSQLRNHGGALGLSWIHDNGFIGIAVSQLEGNYGLPGGHEDDDSMMMPVEEEEGNPTLNLEQMRVDIEAAMNAPFAGVDTINFRFGINDYEHTEFEPNGEPGTRFENDAWEARIEIVHQEIALWSGAAGIQLSDREFSALGDEAFLNPVETSAYGLFWVGERQFDRFNLEAGVRYEEVDHQPTGAFNEMACGSTEPLEDRRFSIASASLGAVVPVAKDSHFKLAIDYANRAPTTEELYSCGEHLATQTFDIGDPGLDKEQAVNVSATWDYQGDQWRFEATAYLIEFSDYIFQRFRDDDNNGEADAVTMGGAPIAEYTQADARFTGFDSKLSVDVARWNENVFSVNALYDTVRAILDKPSLGSRNVSRIPASRYGVGIALASGIYDASIDFQRVNQQDNVSAFELPTDSYNDLAVYLGASIPLDQQSERVAIVFVQGRNLTDDEQRNHASFIKDFAPASGRTIETGFRLVF